MLVLPSCAAGRGYQIMEQARQDQQGLGTALGATAALALIPIYGPLLMIGADGFLIGRHMAIKDAKPAQINGVDTPQNQTPSTPMTQPATETIYVRTTNGYEPAR